MSEKITGGGPLTPRPETVRPASETWNESISPARIPGNAKPNVTEPAPKPRPIETNVRNDGRGPGVDGDGLA